MSNELKLTPSIGAKGSFEFKPPFDTLIPKNQELTVISIRSIPELDQSSVDTLNTVYIPNNLTEDEFKQDTANNVPIVILANEGGAKYTVPSNKINTMPTITGVKYQEKILAINLGSLPVITNLDQAKEILRQDVYDTLGISSQVQTVNSSAVSLMSKEEDAIYTQLRNSRATVDKSYRTRYLETKELLEKRDAKIASLELYIKNNITV